MTSWHDAVLNECMRIEAGYMEDNPQQTLQNIINWHISLATENMVSIWDFVSIRDKINSILGRHKVS